MNKSELVSNTASKAGITKAAAARAVDAVFESVKSALAGGSSVSVPGFGSFMVRKREARQGINPRTKEKINIEASNAPAFRPAKAFKEAVN